MIQVFTDGACSNNGKENAKAGLGVYFGENDPRNTSKRIIGKQTNNVAELSAIIEVFSILRGEIESGENVIIYSDSKIAIGWCTTTGQKYERGGWKKTKGEIPNVDLIKIGYGLCKENQNIRLEYIRAHTGLTDELSLGNEGADRLANEAIGLQSCPYKKQKYYLQIPYSEKEDGKKYGTKWDPKKKRWYYEGFNTDDNFKKLMKLFPY